MARQTQYIVVLTDAERRELESWQRATTLRAGLVKRGRIVLLGANGVPVSHIAARVGMRRRHVEKWLQRFRAHRIDGLADKPGRGRKPFFPSTGGGASGQDGLRAAGQL